MNTLESNDFNGEKQTDKKQFLHLAKRKKNILAS